MTRTLLVIALLLAAGCATMPNTPEQDLVWSAYSACQAEGRIPTNVRLERVEPDGRYWFFYTGGTHGVQVLEDCMKEKFARPTPTATSRPPKG